MEMRPCPTSGGYIGIVYYRSQDEHEVILPLHDRRPRSTKSIIKLQKYSAL